MEHDHRVSAAALVTDDRGRILLVNSPWRGWEYPGGLVEPGETILQALHREIREEAGVEVQVLRFVGVCKNVEKDIVNMDFVCRYVSGELTPSQESTQVIWATEAEAFDLITFPLTRVRLKNMLSGDPNARFFAFTREPFQILEAYSFPVGACHEAE